MILAALFGQLTSVATKIACSQTLYFLFKLYRARMIKNKNVLEKNKKKIEQRLFTGYYENVKRLNLGLVSTTTKASRNESLHESASWDPRPSPFPFSCRPSQATNANARWRLFWRLQESTRQVPISLKPVLKPNSE